MGDLNLLNRVHLPSELHGRLLQQAIDYLMLHSHPSIQSLIALVRDAIDQFGHGRPHAHKDWAEVLLQDVGANKFLHGTDQFGPEFALLGTSTSRLSPGCSVFGSDCTFVCTLSPSIRTNGDQESTQSCGTAEASN